MLRSFAIYVALLISSSSWDVRFDLLLLLLLLMLILGWRSSALEGFTLTLLCLNTGKT